MDAYDAVDAYDPMEPAWPQDLPLQRWLRNATASTTLVGLVDQAAWHSTYSTPTAHPCHGTTPAASFLILLPDLVL